MFVAKFSAIVLSAIALSSLVLGTPVELADIDRRSSYSLNGYGGYPSMSNFDNFYGSNNYDGSHFTEVIETEVVVCHSESIEIVQQRLLVLREMAKRIITEQICEVEVQTIVLHQHLSSMGSYYDDMHRHSGRSVGYDQGLSSRYGSIMNSDGSLSNQDLGFNGNSVGNQYVAVQGDNWNNQTSPSSALQAFSAASSAYTASRSP